MSFNDSVQDLIDAIECRRIVEDGDRSAAFRLRYDAYLREGAIAPDASLSISDRFDDLPNSWIFGFYLEGRLASTIRLSLASGEDDDVPAMTTFADVLEPMLRRGETLLDPTRFVLDAQAAAAHPKLAYVTLRIAWVVADHLEVDHILASVRVEHQAFYRRFFGHGLVCPARAYPSLVKPLSLMSLPSCGARERGYVRYPFLRSSRREFETLMTPNGSSRSWSGVSRPRSDEARKDHATLGV